MEHTISFDKLVQRTCLRIGLQFLLSVILLYLFPLLSVSVKISGAPVLSGGRAGAVFFNVFSWIYLCLALCLIVGVNIGRALKLVKKEMNVVYHNSMWLELRPGGERLTLKEFSETNDRIGKMQRQIQEMLANEKRQREDLIFKVAAASHDLKTPLTVIQGNSDFLMYSDLNEGQRACLSDIATACGKLGKYFNDLISYTKTFCCDRTEWKTYSVRNVAEAAEQEAFYLLKDKSILTVKNDLSEGGDVFLNLNYTLRAISNLIGNACAHGPSERGEIRLRTVYKDHCLIFSVWNKGSHFSKELLDNCTGLFYRNTRAENTGRPHYGIGLAFVKRVAELHLGKLSVANTDDGVEVSLTLRVDFPEQ